MPQNIVQQKREQSKERGNTVQQSNIFSLKEVQCPQFTTSLSPCVLTLFCTFLCIVNQKRNNGAVPYGLIKKTAFHWCRHLCSL